MCEVGTVGKISNYQPEGPGFNLRPDQGLNLGDLLSHTDRGQGRQAFGLVSQLSDRGT